MTSFSAIAIKKCFFWKAWICRKYSTNLFIAFPNGDKKLLAAYTDVAVNGGSCRLKTYSARIHRELIIKCFQPLENFCACILIPAYEIEK